MSRRRVKHEEEHENHERWLVTYADMVTLLMVLFIVMFAMSAVDQRKFNALKAGLAAGFGQSTSVLDGSSSILDEPGTSSVEPINPNAVQDNPEIEEITQQAVMNARALANQRRYAEAEAEADQLEKLQRQIKTALQARGLRADVRTGIDGRGLTVSLVSRHVVFDADVATLTPRGRRIITTLAPILRSVPNKLQIEGHTNQAHGRPKYYPSDWDLSSARAVAVLRLLNEQLGIPASRLSAVGFGHIKPLIDPARAGSQEVNKRVDVVVMSSLVEENRELLDRVADDRSHTASAAAVPASHPDSHPESHTKSHTKSHPVSHTESQRSPS